LQARVWSIATGFALAGVLAVWLLASGRDSSISRAAGGLQAPDLPASPESGLKVGTPTPLQGGDISTWAVVRRAVIAYARPSLSAAPVTRVETQTPEGTTNIVSVLGRRRDKAGRTWVNVRLAVLPNGRTGWIPRAALGGYGVVRTRLVVDLKRFSATLLRNGRAIFRARVGVGKPAWPTPSGEFYVRNRLERYASPVYGPLAFGTSARSPTLTDWPGGGFVGIHGTNEPQLLPGRVSHGCIRMRNEDILELGRLMPVGTPVTVR
jgi:lipoprotein-anchoring transpeptidase ErfK/SrfK